MGEFEGRVVLVTGGAGALGREVGEAFRAAGATLVVSARNRAKLEAAWGRDPGVLIAPADLADAAAAEAMIAAAVARFGHLDVVAHCAGGFRGGSPVHQAPLDELDAMWSSNARSLYFVARAAVPRMLEQGGGTIVAVASGAALHGGAGIAAYSAAKAAALRIVESLDAELGAHGIRVNCVLPGTIDTPANRTAMPDADRRTWVEPGAVAEVIVFLASPRARAVHGAAVPVSAAG